MARIQAFTESDDLAWLFEVPLKGAFESLRTATVVATIEGNEDAPSKVELFAVDHYQAKPFATFEHNADGELARVV